MTNNEIDIFKKLEIENINLSNKISQDNLTNKVFMKNLLEYALTNWENNEKLNELINISIKQNYLIDLLKNEKQLKNILKKYNSLLYLKNITKKYISIQRKIIKEIKSNEQRFINQLIDETIKQFKIQTKKEQIKITKKIIYMIIKEISENENEKIYNLEFISQGQFSNVYKIGNKIIKLGRKRITKRFPNNPYIVKPLIRKEFEVNDKSYLFIEVCENIKTNYCNEEDVYKLYKKMRELGLIWMDPKKENIGILIKDNIIHWNKNLNPSDESLMLDSYRGNEILKAGNIVICDADSIYYDNDKSICKQRVYHYENRYKNEKIDN